MRPPVNSLVLVLAFAVGACGRGGVAEPALWVGEGGAPRVLSFTSPTASPTLAAGPPALDAPVRALLVRRDGSVVALQEPEGATSAVVFPPAVLLSRSGRRVAAFAAEDGAGKRLFHATALDPALPWAAAEDVSGRVWVTGGHAPVVYAPSGALDLVAEELPSASRGIAALEDGRMVVGYGVQDVAIYLPTGAVERKLTADLGASCEGIDALHAAPDGTLLVATRRYGVIDSSGVVVRATLGAGLSLAEDPELSASIGSSIPSALALHRGRVLVAPALGALAPPACARWLTEDLATDEGCAAPGPHRGAAWVE